ncbi:DUF262 domain-containing protein [Vibrio fluvialis]|uniref:DUF262 domain-containing protein n=1 Tax=Vibrio fluvialis TaxID=676 RepID=UPI00117DA554|nr:DUF262 domain-containing protein [Vibrio fluvialis]TRN17442.1 DUF262 domain-containing protein [Vibrio fluvialis]
MLVDNEKVIFEESNDINVSMTDDEINNKYIEGEIRIVTEQARYPIDTISEKIVHNKKYSLNPEFQRRHRWSVEKQSALIESLIMNVPIPPIFLYEYKFSQYEVMDGLQRLTAIANFYDNKFRLTGLTEWPELNGKSYKELPEQVQEGIDRRYISSIILLKETAKSAQQADFMKQMVFDRINSGGEKLEPQERRNSNYNGALNKTCIELTNDENFCNLWDIPTPEVAGNEHDTLSPREQHNYYRKMYDVELVLRFFAYRQRRELQKGLTLETYLDRFLEKGNLIPDSSLKEISNIFSNTMKLTYELFGSTAFWMYRRRKDKWGWYQRATTAIYEPLTYVLSTLIEHEDSLLRNKELIQNDLIEFYTINYDDFEGRNTNTSTLNKRDELFEEFLKKYI